MIELQDRPFGTGNYINMQDTTLPHDHEYLNYLAHIYKHGVDKEDRTGTGARSVFGYMMRFNLMRGIPRLTTKFVPAKTVFDELKWFLEGNTNNERLREINQMHSNQDWSQKDTIWEEWARENGELGPIYSEQWRNFRGKAVSVKDIATQFEVRDGESFQNIVTDDDVVYHGFDQIQEVMNLLKNSPDSRRILVSAWNPTQLKDMALPPCHVLFQFYTRPATYEERRKVYDVRYSHVGADNDINHEYFDDLDIPRRVLCCMLYQRSCDSFLGVPFNILSYSMLTEMMAHQCDMIAGDFIWVGGDCHIYSNHFDQVKEQLLRTPSEKMPQLHFLRKPASIFEYEWTDLEISNYEHQGKIDAPVAT